MTCPNCNSEISDLTAKFCTNCGSPLTVSKPAEPEPVKEPVVEAKPAEPEVKPAEAKPAAAAPIPEPAKKEFKLPPEYKPITAWGYFGWNILFGIPVVGFILLIIFSCGGTKNKNLKNYARSFWCGFLLILIILIIALVISGGKVGNMRLF